VGAPTSRTVTVAAANQPRRRTSRPAARSRLHLHEHDSDPDGRSRATDWTFARWRNIHFTEPVAHLRGGRQLHRHAARDRQPGRPEHHDSKTVTGRPRTRRRRRTSRPAAPVSVAPSRARAAIRTARSRATAGRSATADIDLQNRPHLRGGRQTTPSRCRDRQPGAQSTTTSKDGDGDAPETRRRRRTSRPAAPVSAAPSPARAAIPTGPSRATAGRSAMAGRRRSRIRPHLRGGRHPYGHATRDR